jgi:hypothetical protein
MFLRKIQELEESLILSGLEIRASIKKIKFEITKIAVLRIRDVLFLISLKYDPGGMFFPVRI